MKSISRALIFALIAVMMVAITACVVTDTVDREVENSLSETSELSKETDDLKRLPGLIDGAGTSNFPEVTSENMSILKGFNLTNFMNSGHAWPSQYNQPPKEQDFQMISELGFNFVRVPFDYALFVDNLDNLEFLPEKLQELDEMILYGRKYDIHVMLNMHSAPGFSIIRRDIEGNRLWTEKKEQEAFIEQWRTLAERYKGIPNSELSFNLLNEPNGNDPQYEEIARKAIVAIRHEDPNRLIVSDNINHSITPVKSFMEDGVVASGRGYYPTFISHYRASWIGGSQYFPEPAWPTVVMPGKLYTPGRSSLSGPWNIHFTEPLNSEYRLGIKIRQVSNRITLNMKADGKTVFDWSVVCTDGEGEWDSVVYNEQYNVYVNIFDKYYYADIPAGTSIISIEAVNGDWLSFYDIIVEPVNEGSGITYIITANSADWGNRVSDITFDNDGSINTDKTYIYNKDRLLDYYAECIDYANEGGEIFIGEFGVLHYTPHQVSLDFLETLLEIYKENEWGWALWEFNGAFGILESGRKDVEYELFHGYKLDRKMYELLASYLD